MIKATGQMPAMINPTLVDIRDMLLPNAMCKLILRGIPIGLNKVLSAVKSCKHPVAFYQNKLTL
jgi:hypothetical protein